MKAKGKGEGHPVTCQWSHSGGVEVMGLLMLNLVARWEWAVNAMSWLLYSWERALLSIVEEVVWTPGLAWTSLVKRKWLFKPWIIQPVASCYMVCANSQIIDKCNIKGSLHNVCCWESSITYSECVFVALVTYKVMCIVICGLSGCTIFMSHKWYDIQKATEHKMCVLVFYTSSNISHSKNNSARYYHKFM